MLRKGKSQKQAVIRTLANKEALNFATKRLLKDLEELEKNRLPTVGVTAKPLEDDLFQWHANIRGPEGTPYEGGIFHIEISVPETYPHHPPTINLPVTIPHPNIFENKLCLDMLEEEGWSSAYTILSILIQLQSFLFEMIYDLKDKEALIKKQVQASNTYSCPNKNCKHGGKLACWPPFNSQEADVEKFKIMESEKNIFEQELVCFHTKLNVKETCLGIGISITRIPRTGAINQASPCLDFISLKAFIKEGVRQGLDKSKKFSNWLPLYFGTDKERTIHLGKKAISMLYNNNTKRFKPVMIMDIFPKIMLTLAFLMMDEKLHCSIRLIRLWCHIHAYFLLFMETHPEVYEMLETRLAEFIKDESKRLKDTTPNLGILPCLLLVSNKFKVEDLIEPYFNEQLDRQVFWLLQQVPELGQDQFEKNFGEQRTKYTFKIQSTSYQIFALSLMLIREIKGKKSNKELLVEYEENLGKLKNSQENLIQQKCFQILKLDNYQDFFSFIGMGKIENDVLLEKLKQAISNSKKKKYHGTLDDVMTLPPKEDQIRLLKAKLPKLEDFIDEKEKKFKDNISESDWRVAVLKRNGLLKQIAELRPDLTPHEMSLIQHKAIKENREKPEDLIEQMKITYLRRDELNLEKYEEEDQIRNKAFTWKHLFIKLDIEDHLANMDHFPDFQNFYTKLDVSKDFIEELVIPIITIRSLKSAYHYLTGLLSKLTNLKVLHIMGLQDYSANFLNLKAVKCLQKGFHNFKEAGGKLHKIIYHNFKSDGFVSNEFYEKLWSPILQMNELSSLSCTKNTILSSDLGSKYISNFITIQKNLVELNLSNAGLNNAQAKSLADGLMRAKQLTRLDLSNNVSIGYQGMSSILYNLAFSPKLQYLNIKGGIYTGGFPQVVESIYKLLRISGSLEVIIMSCSNELNPNLSKEFFISLGEIKTLKKLDLSYSGVFSDGLLNLLGKAIAFNAKKGGSLEVLNIEGAIKTSQGVNNLTNSMNISEADHEEWYGDSGKVSKMSGTDFQKIYFNNLRVLNFSNGGNLKSNFNLANWKKMYNPQDPELCKLLAMSSKMENAQLNHCGLVKNDADLLILAFDPSRKLFASKIKILNLSNNHLGKEGCKSISALFEINHFIEIFDISNNKIGVSGAQTLALALAKNKSLKVLNVFANNIDVDGARAFGQTLSTNCSLEWIDFGHNRLRNEGLIALSKGINKNKATAIKTLGLRYNFINDEGFNDFFGNLFSQGGSKPNFSHLFIKNNDLNEYELYSLKKQYDDLGLKIHIDSFDKFEFIENERLERTIWIQPATCSVLEMKRFLEDEQKCGIVIQIRKRKGPKWSNKIKTENSFFFVEFAHGTSVNRALNVASKKKSFINGVPFRIYKGGSGTFLYSKNFYKKKDQKTTVTNIVRREDRERGRGRGRERGVGRGGGRGYRGGGRGERPPYPAGGGFRGGRGA